MTRQEDVQEILERIAELGERSLALVTAGDAVLKTVVSVETYVKDSTKSLGTTTVKGMRGTLKITFTLYASNDTCGFLRIYKNGNQIHSTQSSTENAKTYTTEIYVVDGDVLKFELYSNNSRNYAFCDLLTIGGTISGNGSFS